VICPPSLPCLTPFFNCHTTTHTPHSMPKRLYAYNTSTLPRPNIGGSCTLLARKCAWLLFA
jgi:hypothetical protein